jgi:hypothetical protein
MMQRRILAVALVGAIGVGCSDGPDPELVPVTPSDSMPGAPVTLETRPSDSGSSVARSTDPVEAAVPADVEGRSGVTSVVGSAESSGTLSVPDTTEISGISDDDLVRFVAAVETAIDGSRSAGLVFETPEIYIALAQAACARFSDGASFDEIAASMLAELGSDRPDDDERLVGAVIGAATRTICPEHRDQV